MRVLVVIAGYLPGYKYGGPVRSLSALIEQLGDENEFYVLTSNRDLGSEHPYPEIHVDGWQRVGKARVFYWSAVRWSPRFWAKMLQRIRPDLLYLNSVMWPVTSMVLLWRKLQLLPQIPVILAPRGEFAPSALRQKPRKKRMFLRSAKMLRLYEGLTWQASSESEAKDIRLGMSDGIDVSVAPDLRSPTRRSSAPLRKPVGTARFVWLARISPVKNLVGALELLQEFTDAPVTFDAYGPIEDQAYWEECQAAANLLPATVEFCYRGELAHDEVASALSQYHFLLFPTQGENFGHTIAEALDQGLPILVSDQTPWRDLESAGVGWDMPLDDRENWLRTIRLCLAMVDDEYQGMSARCQDFVDEWMREKGGTVANASMLHRALASRETIR